MTRPLRIEYPGAVYHVTSRGNARQAIFLSDRGRRAFLEVLAKAKSRFKLLIHAFCLMENHYHLLLETPEGNLSSAMRHVNGVYTQTFNRTNKRFGHLFQGRYKAILVDKETHLLSLSRYIVLNPVRAGLVEHPKDWPWSSYHDTAYRLRKKNTFLSVNWVLSQFGRSRQQARQSYSRFVLSSDSSNPLSEVRSQCILGSDKFLKSVAERVWEKDEIEEIPRKQRQVGRPPLEALLMNVTGRNKEERNRLIYEAISDFGYSQKEVAGYTGLHYVTISRIVAAAEAQGG